VIKWLKVYLSLQKLANWARLVLVGVCWVKSRELQEEDMVRQTKVTQLGGRLYC